MLSHRVAILLGGALCCLSGLGARAAPTLTTLANFYGANGSQPSAPLTIDLFGDLFGITASGGSAGGVAGTVFKL